MKLTAIFKPQKLQAAVTPEALGAVIDPPVLREQSDPYPGPYTVTPSAEEQTLATRGKTMAADVTVDAIPAGYADVSGTTAEAGDVESGKLFVTAAGVLTEGTATMATLTTKEITENGTYDAQDDGADGYSEVTVDVPQGIIVPAGWGYYNGYLLPKIPYADGYNYAFIRKNGQTGMWDCVLGTGQWKARSSATADNWAIEFPNETTVGARQYSIPQSGNTTTATDWGEVTVSYSSYYGTNSNRKVVFSNEDILLSNNNILLVKGIPFEGQ